MNKYSMKRCLLLGISVMMLSATWGKNADFSGQWTLNESKSEMGQFAMIVPLKIDANDKTDSISITKETPGFDGGGMNKVTEILGFKGKEVESIVPPGNSKRKASAKWSEDGQTLTITYSIMLDFNGETSEVKGTEVWTLVDGGKALTVTSTSSSSFGENAFKGYYEKK